MMKTRASRNVGRAAWRRAIRIIAVVVMTLGGGTALGEEQSLLGKLQGELAASEFTMSGLQNDAGLCEGLVSELVTKIDRSSPGSDRATLKGYLKTARKCEAKTKQVFRDGASLQRRCATVLDDLRAVDDAPAGSNAARRQGTTRKAAQGCVAGFAKWEGQIEELKELLNTAVEIIRAT